MSVDAYQLELDSWRDRCARLEAAYEKTQLPAWVHELFWLISLASLVVGYVLANGLFGVESTLVRLIIGLAFVWLTCKFLAGFYTRRRRKAYQALTTALYEIPFRKDELTYR